MACLRISMIFIDIGRSNDWWSKINSTHEDDPDASWQANTQWTGATANCMYMARSKWITAYLCCMHTHGRLYSKDTCLTQIIWPFVTEWWVMSEGIWDKTLVWIASNLLDVKVQASGQCRLHPRPITFLRASAHLEYSYVSCLWFKVIGRSIRQNTQIKPTNYPSHRSCSTHSYSGTWCRIILRLISFNDNC